MHSQGRRSIYLLKAVRVVGLAGAFYRLCWAHEPASLADFAVEVDSSVDLAGPFVRTVECTLGLECLVMLEGYLLSSTNRMVLVNGSCGDPDAQVANETWTTANATSLEDFYYYYYNLRSYILPLHLTTQI